MKLTLKKHRFRIFLQFSRKTKINDPGQARKTTQCQQSVKESLPTPWGTSGKTLSSGLTGVGAALVGSSAGEGMGGGGIRTESAVVVLEVVVVTGAVAVAVAVAVVFSTGTHSDSFMRWVLPLDTGNCNRRVADSCSFSAGVLIGRGFASWISQRKNSIRSTIGKKNLLMMYRY